ncbi:sugar phosphate isomerase/epimerase [Mobilisporobacter senegalensis]|uniref:Sugar phosphate isomerase/epimerase n=1 Tax=Mobilisporobacter senegalensis TaxID=1329262 RepID=A0A3N1XZA8_9FIRM|nr:sugar phosphate isomerase/epimerase [Mobilisporobacter senegalensis]ROR31571.1 sugar phosphate isomerase/epimerase [Mobilisporobacter senegalensis]
MRLSYIPDSLGYMKLEDMLDTVHSLGVNAIEFTTGNWSQAPHINLDELVSSLEARKYLQDSFDKRDMEIIALNCSGNPLAFQKDMDVTLKTFQLAEQLGIKKIVMMSGLPSGCREDKTPVWITTSWPPMTQDILKYQWEEVAIPAWKKLVDQAKHFGIEKIALENHAWQLVYNPETLFKLRNEVGTMIGMNLDPSHLFWMGGEPIEAARELGSALYHIHGKDSRLERGKVGPNGVLDTKVIEEYKNRSWNYVAIGCGHDVKWWKEFFSVARMSGYDDVVSLEMEDLTMDALTGVKMSINTLKQGLGII